MRVFTEYIYERDLQVLCGEGDNRSNNGVFVSIVVTYTAIKDCHSGFDSPYD